MNDTGRMQEVTYNTNQEDYYNSHYFGVGGPCLLVVKEGIC